MFWKHIEGDNSNHLKGCDIFLRLFFVTMSFVNEGLIPVTSQGIVLLAYITSAIACTIAAALFYWRLVDVEGNPVPNGPLGVPMIGTLYSSR
jgi:hypothetical protein